MRTWAKVWAAAAAVVLVVGGAAVVGQDAGRMDKSLERFTVGDLFPKLAEGLRETAASWKNAGESARSVAASKQKNVRDAMPPVKAQLEQAKRAAKDADKSKDFVAAGTAQGQVKSGEAVMDVLNRLDRVASTQSDLADAWAKAGDKMKAFAEADEAFDRYRSNGIAKPAQGQQDSRLNSAGYDAFKNRARALRELGEALYQMSVKTRNLGDDQLKFADELQKGGHVQVGK